MVYSLYMRKISEKDSANAHGGVSEKRFYKHKVENLVVVERIVTIHYFEFTKDYGFEGESHDFWEFAYADKGELICSRGEGDILLRQGGIIFHKPDEFHTIRSDGVTAPNAFVMSFVCRSAAMSFFDGKQFMLPAKLKQFISAIMAEAEGTFALPRFDPHLKKLRLLPSPNLGGQQMIRTYLEQFLILLMRQQSQKDGTAEVFLPKESFGGHIEGLVNAYLAENLYGRISLSELCARLNYGKTFLCTQYKKSTGQTIFGRFAQLKIEEAKKLIREKNHTFRQISELLGFDSPAHFTGAFKRLTSMTPTEYLESVR